mgnify:CR=1 FL=1
MWTRQLILLALTSAANGADLLELRAASIDRFFNSSGAARPATLVRRAASHGATGVGRGSSTQTRRTPAKMMKTARRLWTSIAASLRSRARRGRAARPNRRANAATARVSSSLRRHTCGTWRIARGSCRLLLTRRRRARSATFY